MYQRIPLGFLPWICLGDVLRVAVAQRCQALSEGYRSTQRQVVIKSAPYLGAFHGSSAKQEVAVEARHASFA